MNLDKLENICVNELTKMVSFDRTNILAEYKDYEDDSMQAKQAEGAACLFNLLNEKGIALLADEVGMGKTIQALSVIIALWNQKKDAKILVLAPRQEVAINWINEYETFVNVHYKVKDDIVKTRIGNSIVNPAIYANNLFELTSQVKEGWGKLYIGKITSFSSLLSKEDVNSRLSEIGIKCRLKSNDKIEQVKEIARVLSQEIKNQLKDNQFDLIIIDEAHYFRNANGDSLRVAAAKEFFGKELNKLSHRVLLLTATPNHSSSSNIKAVVSYFDDGLFEKENYSVNQILENICIRRFRRLSKHNLIKYNYRNEIQMPSNFDGNIKAELFFGVYQKLLAKSYLNEKSEGSKRNMLHFLEGTEFIPNKVENELENEKNKEHSDFSKGLDGDMLVELSSKYKKIFNDYPAHPKYEKLMSELIQANDNLSSLNEKKLVFVRRIPSVKEIANRGIHRYDEILLDKINQATGLKMKFSDARNFRAYFNNKISLSDINREEDSINSDDEGAIIETDKVPNSQILDLFKVIKTNKIKSTAATNFRLRFTRSKPSIFNIFFSPGSNYFNKPYLIDFVETDYGNNKFSDNYFASCLINRLENSELDNPSLRNQVFSSLIGSSDYNENQDSITKPKVALETLLTVYWSIIKDIKPENEYLDIKNTYQSFNLYKKEALSNFIEKGLLLASSSLVDLYCSFLKCNKSAKKLQALELYTAFIKQVKEDIKLTPIIELIDYSILHFDVISEKVFNLRDGISLLNVKWENFYNAQPIYPYSAETKNNKVLSSFNTPFFPDILVSTSVLQEGVNLQYFCDKVIHYGVAWTPGDNEQRVGRVDRMFSKVERNINNHKDADLKIIYPYLENTIDQDHVSNFIYKKYFEESFIDRCDSAGTKMTFNPEEMGIENWKDYFRIPQIVNLEDPFCAKSMLLKLGPTSFKYKCKEYLSNLKSEIVNTFIDFLKIPVYQPRTENSTICILDPSIKGERKQPVYVELNYLPYLQNVSDNIAYSLSLLTPLGNKKSIEKYVNNYDKFKDIYEKFPNLKLCLNYDSKNDTNFVVYMRVDIPVFPNHYSRPLSRKELLTNFQDLIQCADKIEELVTKSDIKIDVNDLENIGKEENAVLRSSSIKNFKANSWNKFDNSKYLVRKSNLLKYRNMKQKEAWILNHEKYFLKFQGDSKVGALITSILFGDVQKIEINILNHVFEKQLKN